MSFGDFVQSSGWSGFSSGTSINRSLTGVTAHNILVFIVTYGSAGTGVWTISDGTNAWKIAVVSQTNGQQLIAYLLDAPAGNYTVTGSTSGSASNLDAILLEYSASAAAVFDCGAFGCQNSAISSPGVSGSIWLSSAGELVIAGISDGSGSSVGSPFTQRGNDSYTAVGDHVESTAGRKDYTLSAGFSGSECALFAAFAPAAFTLKRPALLQNSWDGSFPSGSHSQAFFRNTSLNSLLIAMVFDKGASQSPPANALTDTAGNTWTQVDKVLRPGTSVWATMYFCKNKSAGADTVTYNNGSNTGSYLYLLEFSNCDGTLDTHATGSDPNNASVSTGTFSTAKINELIVSFEVDNDALGPTTTTVGGAAMNMTDNADFYMIATSILSSVQVTTGFSFICASAIIAAAFNPVNPAIEYSYAFEA
jgi:hypothetical protein